MNDKPSENSDPSWFEKPSSIRLMTIALVVVCIGLLLAEFTYENHHPHFDLEKVFGFQALFGFVAFIAVVFLGMGLRLIIKRDEDYYDR